MGSVRDILIRFLGDASGLKGATRDAEGGVRSFSDRLDLLGKKVGAAEGVGGKLKAGWSGLGDVFGGTAGKAAIATAGVGALATVAGKAVTEFEDATVEVGKFRDATGTTSEEASRFVEVFNDLGIGAEAGATAIGRMEKALGQNAHAFDEYGVAVVRAKDGTIDAQGTFLNAVDALNRIQDPAKRAAAGADIFGKGWQGMAEIIGSGAPALKTALESVQPSKIFTDADIQAGRNVRDAFDRLADAGEGLLLTLGKSLAPAVAELAPILADVIEAAEPLVEVLGGTLSDAMRDLGPAIKTTADTLKPLIEGLSTLTEVASKVVNPVSTATEAITGLAGKTADMRLPLDEFTASMKAQGVEGEQLAAMLRLWTEENSKTAGSVTDLGDAWRKFSFMTDETADAIRKRQAAEKADQSAAYEKAVEARTRALEAEKRAIEEVQRAQEELLRAEMSSVDTGFRLADSTDRLAAAAWEYNTSAEKTPQMVRGLTEAAWESAQAFLADANAKAAAEQKTLSSAEQADILRTALINAANAPGIPAEVRDSILETASAIKGFPDDKTINVSAPGAKDAAIDLTDVRTQQDKILPTTSISTEVRNQALTWGLLEAVRLKGVEVDQLAPTVSVSVQGYATAISQLREIAAAAAAAQSAAARAASASVASAQSAQAKINQLRAGAII